MPLLTTNTLNESKRKHLALTNSEVIDILLQLRYALPVITTVTGIPLYGPKIRVGCDVMQNSVRIILLPATNIHNWVLYHMLQYAYFQIRAVRCR